MFDCIVIVALKTKSHTQAEEFDTKCTCIFLNYILQCMPSTFIHFNRMSTRTSANLPEIHEQKTTGISKSYKIKTQYNDVNIHTLVKKQ